MLVLNFCWGLRKLSPNDFSVGIPTQRPHKFQLPDLLKARAGVVVEGVGTGVVVDGVGTGVVVLGVGTGVVVDGVGDGVGVVVEGVGEGVGVVVDGVGEGVGFGLVTFVTVAV